MSDISQIPVRIEQITPEWLTIALRNSGWISNSVILSFVPELLAGGFTGTVARLRLTYDVEETGAPLTVIGKLAKSVQEVRFYEEIAGQVVLRIPMLYFSANQKQTGECIQLMEDLAPAQAGDDVAGCTNEQAELAFEHLARFHANWWERPALYELNWLPLLEGKFQNEAGFQDAWRQLLPDSMSEIGRRLNVSSLLSVLSQSPQTLIHGDCKASNFLFAQIETGFTFAVIDWQQCARGVAAYDAAYFCVKNLSPQQLTDHSLLHYYHDLLLKHGVSEYKFDQFLLDYRVSLLLLVHRFVVVGRSLSKHEERKVLFTAWLERLIAANEEYCTIELLQ